MNYRRLLIVLCMFIVGSASSSAQSKRKIHYLVDTANVNLSRPVDIIGTGGEIVYVFNCLCLPKKQNIKFAYLQSRSAKPQPNRPSLPYVSWKELLGLVDNDIAKFGDKYEMYITEKLPNGSFVTNKVFWIVDTIVD